MNASSVLVWIGFLLLLLLTIMARHILKSWLAPGAFFALYWCVASIIPFFVLPNDEISVGTVLWILFSVIAVFLGSVLGLRGKIYRISKSKKWSISQISLLKFTVIVSSLLGVGVTLSTLQDSGYGVRSLLSPSRLVKVANWFSEGRYLGTYSPPLISQLLLIFVYVAPMIGGFLIGIAPKKQNLLLSFLSLLPAVLIMMVRTQRGVLVVAGVFWMSAYLAANCAHGRLDLFTKLRVWIILLAFPSIVFIFALVALARAGTTDTSLLPMLFRKVTSGAAGHMTAFSWWFEKRGAKGLPPFLGQITFAGIFNALGIYERKLGLFQEFVLLRSGFNTNIYTIFRPLILDFTLFGALILLFFSGFVAGIAYQFVLIGKVRFVPLLTAFYATVMFSFNTSLWIWNTVLIGFVGYAGLLWFLPLIKRRSSRASLSCD